MQPAGWYADPSGAPQQRWWNGIGWGDQTRPGGGTVPPAPPRRSRTGRVVALILVLSLVVLGTLAGVGVWAVRQVAGNPRTAAATFFTALQEDRYGAAAAMLCGSFGEDGEARLHSASPEPVYDWSSTSVTRSGDTATVAGALTTGSASAYEITVRLVRESGDWKVCSLPGG